MADKSFTEFVQALSPTIPATVSQLEGSTSTPSSLPTQGQDQTSAPNSKVEQAVLSGQYAFPKSKRVNVVDGSGQSFNLPGDQVSDALKNGYRIETARQQAVREAVKENDNLTGAAKVALRQFANQALFEIPELVNEHVSDPFEVEKERAIKESHAFANAVGGVAGFGASLFAGGPLFQGASKAGQLAERVVAKKIAEMGVERGAKSIAKDIVARTVTNATKMGVEGAIVMTPKAITETALGDPGAGAEALLMGGGLGLGLGAVSGPVGKAIQALKPKSTESVVGTLEGVRNERVAKALGFSKGQVKKLKKGQEEAEEIAEHIFNSKLSTGQDIIGPTSTTEEIANNLFQFKEERGQRIGDIYKTLSESGHKVKTYDFAKKIDDQVATLFKGNLNKEERNIANGVMEDVLALGPEISLSDAKSFMDDIGKVAYPGGKMPLNPTPKQTVARDLWTSMRGYIDETAEKAAKDLGDSALYEDLLGARKDYSAATKAVKAIEDKIASENGNKLFGLTDTITGVGAGAATGPAGALASVLAKKAFEKYGNVLAADLLDRSIDGVLAVSKFMNKTSAKLGEIPGAIASLSKIREAAIPTVASSSSAMARFMGDESKNREEAFHDMRMKLADIQANPAVLADNIANNLTPLQQTGAPKVADAFNQKISSALGYIYQNMPKPISPENPFHNVPFKPSDSDLAKFERKLSVVLDPFVVIDALKGGTLTKEHMDSLQANYPILYSAIRSKVIDHVIEEKPNLPYQARLKLSLLMGMNIDGSISPQSILSLQNSFALGNQMDQNGDGLSQTGLNKMEPAKMAITGPQGALMPKE